MSEFAQKMIIAITSALLGGLIGFGSKLFILEREGENERFEFARESQYGFLKEMYEERKEAYLEIDKARWEAHRDPSEENLDELLEKFSDIPFIGPRLPTNNMILGYRGIVASKLEELSDEKKIIDFLYHDMRQYVCVFDVNLQTLEGMMYRLATEDEVNEIRELATSVELASLDQSCLAK